MAAGRNRLSRVANIRRIRKSKGARKLRRELGLDVKGGIFPSALSGIVFSAIQNEKFYILLGALPEYETSIRTRMEEILQERNPTLLDELMK